MTEGRRVSGVALAIALNLRLEILEASNAKVKEANWTKGAVRPSKGSGWLRREQAQPPTGGDVDRRPPDCNRPDVSVCERHDPTGEPDAGKLQVRFGEQGLETWPIRAEPRTEAKATDRHRTPPFHLQTWNSLSGSVVDRACERNGVLGACRELAPSKQESTTYEPSLVCKLLILGCRLLIPDRLLA